MINLFTKLRKYAVLIILLTSPMIVLCGCASNKGAEVSGEGQKLITDIVTSDEADATSVSVKGNRLLTYTSNKQVFPLGVVFYFPETKLGNIDTIYEPPENEVISSIRANEIKEDDQTPTTRLFIALKRDVPYDISPDEAGLKISFPKATQVRAAAKAPSTAEKAEPKQPLPPAVHKSTPAATRLQSITATALQKNVVINVKANGTIKKFKTFTVDNPPRIVVDITDLKSPFKNEQRVAVKSKWIKQVRHFGHPDKVRVVLDATNKAYLKTFSTTPIDNGLLIHVGQTVPPQAKASPQTPVVAKAEPPAKAASKEPAKTAETKTPPAEPKQEDAAPATPKAAPAETKKEAAKDQPEMKKEEPDRPAWVNRIDFTGEEAGRSSVIIGTTRPVTYEIKKVDGRKVNLKLFGANLPEYRKRALITTRFESAVDRITPVQTAAMKDDSVFIIELREAVPYYVDQKDNIIRVNFSASKIPPKPYEDAELPAWKKSMADVDQAPAAKGAKAQMAAAPEAGVTPEQKPEKELSLEERLKLASPEKKYTGEKIALDFYDTDIKNVFRIIREISGKNFAIDKTVTGKVTLTLEKPVPWDQVLDLVLKMNQLGMTMEGDIIRIATLTTLAQEEKLRQAKLKAEQQALKQQQALEPLITEYLPVNYSNAKIEVLPHIQVVLTENRGKASVDERNNQLIVTDTVEKIRMVKEIVEKIDQVTPQVIIEARIVEANTNFSRALGFDWGEVTLGTFDIGNWDIGPSTFQASNLPDADPTAVLGFNFAKLGGTPFTIIDAKLEASEVEGKTNILSAPKVITLDNKKAKIKQGFEIPYQERDSSGNSTVRFKDVDLLLEVTPSVTPDNRIAMNIFVTKNEVFEQTQQGPALSTNEAETEILIDDGDTVVIGGILKSTK
ncbi:MAG: type IV pilus secretin PilQ, partial [Deltaproteobacteria bacterium]|nr:type IV pilus secretin PilQ [Deltaproteobacteria bacterium]